MTDYSNLVERYVDVWNEPDPARRLAAVRELWAEDGVYVAKSMEARGHRAIEARIADEHALLVARRGYRFRAAYNADGHHNVVKFNWQMLPAEGGEVAAVGFDFFVLGDDGRIRADYQFIEV